MKAIFLVGSCALAVTAVPAQAVVVIAVFTEGTGVRMNVTGQIDLAGLGAGITSSRTGRADIRADDPSVTIGGTSSLRSFTGAATGPGALGSGTVNRSTNTYSGDVFEFSFNPTASTGRVAFGPDYVSNQRLTATALFANSTIAGLGLTTGDYVYTLSNNDTVTFVIGRDATAPLPAAVPEPATWGLMLAGFGLVGTGLRSRRRSAVTYA